MTSVIRPLEIERRYGRLMRAPDGHDDGGAGAGAGAAGAGEAGADGGAGDGAAGGDQAKDGAGAGAADTAGEGDGDGAGADGDDGSLIGGAGTKDNDDDGSGGDGDGGGDDDKTPAVPDSYELAPVTIGEGDDAVELQIDADLLADVTPGLKEAGVTAEQAQKLAPLALKIEERVRSRLNDEFRSVTTQWAKDAKADPEIGGKNFTATMENVAKALDHFGAPSEIKEVEVDGKKVKQETNPFRVFLNQTGFGNHPQLIRMFAKVGAAVGEDGALPRGDKGAAVKKSSAEILYPDDAPKGA